MAQQLHIRITSPLAISPKRPEQRCAESCNILLGTQADDSGGSESPSVRGIDM